MTLVLYFANPCTPAVIAAMRAGALGYIDTPVQGNRRPDDVAWCADNGCFGRGYPGDDAFLRWLDGARGIDRCAFATAPDVVGDAGATLVRSLPLLPTIRDLGFRAALVGQDGLEDVVVPWDAFDAFFIGGTTAWKLGVAARALAGEARSRGKWLHMGRVNSRRRYRYAESIGCDSVDGTFLTFGPDTNLPRLAAWLLEMPLPIGDAA